MVRALIWYLNLDSDIINFVKSCAQCQSVASNPPENECVEWPIPPRPWSRLHVDHFFFENNICLLLIDLLGKYLNVEIVKSTSTDDTIDALRLVFSRHGLCDALVSDNASCFTASAFKKFLSNNGIIHLTPPPLSPATNGHSPGAQRHLIHISRTKGMVHSWHD